jgi:hypothetical protein
VPVLALGHHPAAHKPGRLNRQLVAIHLHRLSVFEFECATLGGHFSHLAVLFAVGALSVQIVADCAGVNTAIFCEFSHPFGVVCESDFAIHLFIIFIALSKLESGAIIQYFVLRRKFFENILQKNVMDNGY